MHYLKKSKLIQKIHHKQHTKILHEDKIQPYTFTALPHLSFPNHGLGSKQTLFTKTVGGTGCSFPI